MTRKSKETEDSAAVLATKPERQRCPDQDAHWAGPITIGSSGAASPGSAAACIALAAAHAVSGTQIDTSPGWWKWSASQRALPPVARAEGRETRIEGSAW